ncbi:MAG: hypothetical protein K2K69_09060 [Muribaculaceae bacterium]|nr:hypothetical protein [Muribaculaceae bacterium]
MGKRITIALIFAAILTTIVAPELCARRRITPVETPATGTQAINETRNDTSRINAKRREGSVAIVNERGLLVYIDTISGEEWVDSMALFQGRPIPKMEYPLLQALTVGVNVWDPIMRAFGQKYGVADAWVQLSLHNRYKPIVEVGLGKADNTPPNMNFTYRSPMSVYFKIGADYNFFYNSNPDYSLNAGLRYGFAPFSFKLDDVTLDSPYWDETTAIAFPSQSMTAGWLEVVFGLQVKIWGPISAGWSFRYKTKLHESKSAIGSPWYIPGYGSRNTSISGSFSIAYTLPLTHLNKSRSKSVITDESDSPSPYTEPVVPDSAAASQTTVINEISATEE